jgi:DNA-binding NarL/FixJ family response regulator
MAESTDPELIERVICAGARGFLQDASRENEVVMAVETVADGSIWAPRRILAHLIEHGLTQPNANHSSSRLTSREQQVLELLVGGTTNRQIGGTLHIEERTVKAHIAKLMRKVGVNNRTALTMYAIDHHLISGRQPAVGRKKTL